ncbi:MAG: Crp/Fnr family transcriptional regulator [Candidatus Bipolaricaulota bacterium]|nr:Crp/Fnr family transcriptional regulator [Candidatus Bipolaricaulota bacterium]
MGAIPTSVDERVTLLKRLKSPYYQGLDESQLCIIAEPARLIEAHAGEFLYHQGEPALYSYLLLSGLVKLIHHHSSGRPLIVRFIKPGMAFCVAYFGTISSYCVSEQAVTDVRALRWDMEDAIRLLHMFPSVALSSIAVMQQMYMDLVETLNWFACGSAEERLFWMVRRLAEDLRENDHAILSITQQELADSTGLSLYTVNRILKSWERRGLVERHRRALIVWPERLASVCKYRE